MEHFPTRPNPARDDAITAIRFPIRLLTVALVLTTAAFAWFGWCIFDLSRDAKIFRDQSTRMEELGGAIVHLDEVLTMSARMAAATGDSNWEQRYRRFEPQLDAAIKETKKLGTTPHDNKAAAQTDEANARLVEMENRVFALVLANRKEEAQAVVFSPEYEAQKRIYAEGIESFNSQIRREVDERERQDKRISFLSMLSALVVLAISFAAWWSVVSGLRRWRADLEHAVSQRRQAEQALQRAHRELEARIEQRTAELEKTNEALQAEIAGRQQIERAMRQSEAEFRAMFELVSVGIGQADPRTGQWLRVNQKMCAITGYSAAEMLQMRVSEITRPEDRERFERVVRGELPDYCMEKRYLRKDGALVWVSVNMTIIRDTAGQPTRTIAAIEDITQRKQYEEALRRSEERFRIVAETTNDVIYEWDLKQGLEWEGKIDDMLGYEPGEFPKTLSGWTDSVHPEDLGRTMAAIQALLEGHAPYAIEYRVRRKDGIYRWWSARGAVARTPDGTPTRMIGSITDITERKQAEAARDRLATIIESTTDLVGVSDTAGNHLYLNRAGRTLLGVGLDEDITKTNSANFVPNPASHRTITEGIPSAARLGIWSGEVVLLSRSGQEFPVSQVILAHKTANGEVESFSTIMRDITERKEAEAVQEQRTRELLQVNATLQHEIGERERVQTFLNSVVEHLPIAVFIKEAKEFRFVLWNKAGEKLTGIPNAEMIGKNDFDFFPQADAERNVTKDRAAFASKGVLEIPEEIIQTRDHGARIVHVWKVPIFDATGQPAFLLGIAEDITERKHAQAELGSIHRQLVDASRRDGMAEIATNVLHNVGNVLNSVNISTGLIVEGVKKSKGSRLARVVAMLREHTHDLGEFITHDAKGKQLPVYLAQLSDHLAADQADLVGEVDSLRRNVDHIKEIVALQQEYAMAGGVKEIINVVNLVEDSLRMNEDALSRHRVEVIREFSTVPPMNVEKHKILQILVNLVRNAEHACQDSECADKQLTMRVANGAGRVRISVIDNGIGVPQENLTRIFNHGFTTRKGGHGFGLHSGALAAGEMGGSLTVHSDGPGQGATFTLELPLPTVEELA